MPYFTLCICSVNMLWKVGKTSIWSVAAMALVLLLMMEASNRLARQHCSACRENTMLNSRIKQTQTASLSHVEKHSSY